MARYSHDQPPVSLARLFWQFILQIVLEVVRAILRHLED